MPKPITPSTTPTSKEYTTPSRTMSREYGSERSGPTAHAADQTRPDTPAASAGLKLSGDFGAQKKNGEPPEENVFTQLPDEQKVAIARYIYEFMIARDMKSQDGYLIKDVLAEVEQGTRMVGPYARGGLSELVNQGFSELRGRRRRISEQTFVAILRFAPQYFTIFRASIGLVGLHVWSARKSERMLRLTVPEPGCQGLAGLSGTVLQHTSENT
jgi:hypothetical protein